MIEIRINEEVVEKLGNRVSTSFLLMDTSGVVLSYMKIRTNSTLRLPEELLTTEAYPGKQELVKLMLGGIVKVYKDGKEMTPKEVLVLSVQNT